MTLELNESNFKNTIEKGVALIEFWAPWCGPCKMMSPLIDKIANNNPDLIVGKVDIDASQNISQMYNIQSIPTIIIFKNGEAMEQTVGVVNEKTIMNKVESVKSS